MSASLNGRALAIIAGCAFAAGGLTILLDKDLITPLLWQSNQWLTIIMVFGTIAAGHLMVDAGRARHVFATLGFLVLFLAGTGLVVYSSVGRQVESAGSTTLSVEDTNRQIADKTEDVKAAKARRDYAEAQVQREMTGSRCGKRCKDWKQNASDISVVIDKLEAEIAALGPQKPVNAQAAAVADIAALFGFTNKARTVAILLLVVPFLKTLFFEIGSIVCLGFAFRQGKQRVIVAANDTAQTAFSISKGDAEKAKALVSGEFPDPTPPNPGNRKKVRFPASNVVDFHKHPVVTALENNGGSVSSNRLLSELMSVSEGEASKRWQEIEHLLDVHKVGKQLTIALKA